MNKERILALADLVETQPHTKVSDNSGFNMDNWYHTCGTPSCIAGWAIAMRRGGGDNIILKAKSHFDEGADFLEISVHVAEELFLPDSDYVDWDSITPAVAASALRRLATTGVVDWMEAGASAQEDLEDDL